MEKDDTVDDSDSLIASAHQQSSAVILMCWRKGPVDRILRVWEVLFKAIGKDPLETTFFIFKFDTLAI